MSYCRMSKNSDVYVYGGKDGLVCCGCRLTIARTPLEWYVGRWVIDWVALLVNILALLSLGFIRPNWTITLWFGWSWVQHHHGRTDFVAQSPEEMLAHLYKHKKAGHKVPKYATRRLRKEAHEAKWLSGAYDD